MFVYVSICLSFVYLYIYLHLFFTFLSIYMYMSTYVYICICMFKVLYTYIADVVIFGMTPLKATHGFSNAVDEQDAACCYVP